MAYVRKTVDCWRLFVNYGQGWEYEGTDSSLRAARQTLKSHRENCPQYPARIVFGRERKENEQVLSWRQSGREQQCR